MNMYNNNPSDYNIAMGAAGDNNLLNFDQINKLKGYVFWMKLFVILTFIGLVPSLLIGALLSLIIIGLPVLVIVIFGFYLNFKLWKAAEYLEAISSNNNQQVFNFNALEFIIKIGSYFKLSVILGIVAIVLLIIINILFIVLFPILENSIIQMFDEDESFKTYSLALKIN